MVIYITKIEICITMNIQVNHIQKWIQTRIWEFENPEALRMF